MATDLYLDWLDNTKLAIRNAIDTAISKQNTGLVGLDINAEAIADIIVNSMHGPKSQKSSVADLKKRAENIVSLVMTALNHTY